MPYRIIKNKKYNTFVIHAVANSGNVVIAGNTSSSNVAVSDEVLTGAYIKQAWFGSPSGANAFWTVSRGANVVAVYDSTAWIDYAGNGSGLKVDSSANLVLTLTGSTVGYIMLELKKETAAQWPDSDY